MRLLFDQNLSRRLTTLLSDVFRDSLHTRQAALAQASDGVVWDYALANGLTIVSKDSDFRQRSLVFGAPPKVILLTVGNCSTGQIADILRSSAATIAAFIADPVAALLELP